MNKSKNKIIRLMIILIIASILSFMTIVISFHHVMNIQIQLKAIETIENSTKYLTSTDDDTITASDYTEDTHYNIVIIPIDKTYNSIDDPINRQEKDIIESNILSSIKDNEIIKKEIKGRIYYINVLKENNLDPSMYFLQYVDVTADMDMIGVIEIMMLIIIVSFYIIVGSFGVFKVINIEKINKKQKEFFENVSHELKTPLMSIQGYAMGIQEGVLKDIDKSMGIIIQESNKMNSLVEDILQVSKIEFNKNKPKKEKMDINEAINNALMSLEPIINKKNIEVDIRIDNSYIYADPIMVDMMLINIINNATKFSLQQIKIELKNNKLTVWNDGDQITDDDKKHIFDRFYIGAKGSTGIGLALSKTIARKHSWIIYAESINLGTSIIVEFKKRCKKDKV